MNNDPMTLAEKLAPRGEDTANETAATHPIRLVLWVLNICVVTALTVIPLIWAAGASDTASNLSALFLALLAVWGVTAFGLRPLRSKSERDKTTHFLLSGDRQGFVGGLQLADKTAVFDGSNIYHFGLDQDEGARPLRLLADALRQDGYRVVCFFDANIFYTLTDHGAISADQRHSTDILCGQFGLHPDEIYIVPSGVQADKYILSTLTHLPTSFAITNDQFRDYAKSYGAVMKGDQWRKGVAIKGAELRLLKHKFATPILLTQGR